MDDWIARGNEIVTLIVSDGVNKNGTVDKDDTFWDALTIVKKIATAIFEKRNNKYTKRISLKEK